MKHEIDLERLGPGGEEMTGPIESCVHCGFCLPTCPTYVTLGEEMDSPRGRIFLMKEVLEGKLELEQALPYVDNCLGCEACVTACPSGVQYGDLLTGFRGRAETRRHRPPLERAQRELALGVLARPRVLRPAAALGRLGRHVAGLLPRSSAAMVRLLPQRLPRRLALPEVVPAHGERRARVALLAGCAQQVLAPSINAAALRVLARNGVEVVIPPAQGCCGSLALHSGAAEQARELARVNLEAFPRDVEAVITTAAGCGSGMGSYGTLFAGEPERERAQELAGQSVDVTRFLAELGLREAPPALERPLAVAYHDACHLAHAQGVRSEPRELLGAVAGLQLVEPPEWELCCGSAGIYNLERPEVAGRLGERKARNLQGTGAQLISSGNIGCLTQIGAHLQGLGSRIPVMHTIEVLDRAYSQTLTEGDDR